MDILRKYTNFEQAVRDDFEWRLKFAVEKGEISSETLLDQDTQNALREIAKIYPEYDIELVRKARRELELQLDGTHARQRSEEIANYLREHPA